MAKIFNYRNMTNKVLTIADEDGAPQTVQPGSFVAGKDRLGNHRGRTSSEWYDRFVGKYGLDKVPSDTVMSVSKKGVDGLRKGLKKKTVQMTNDRDPNNYLVRPHAGTFNAQQGIPQVLRKDGQVARGPLLGQGREGAEIAVPSTLNMGTSDEAIDRVIAEASQRAGNVTIQVPESDEAVPSINGGEFDDGVVLSQSAAVKGEAGKGVYAVPVEGAPANEDPAALVEYACPICEETFPQDALEGHVADEHPESWDKYIEARETGKLRQVAAPVAQPAQTNTKKKKAKGKKRK